MSSLLFRDVDDFTVVGDLVVERQRDRLGSIDVGTVYRLDMEVRFGAVARVPTAREGVAGANPFARSHPHARLLQMAEDDDDAAALDEHVIAHKGSPATGHASPLSQCVPD